MSRGPRPSTLRKWTERFERFRQSGQSVSQFCKEASVSTASFYQWRRRLAGSSPTRSRSTTIGVGRPGEAMPVPAAGDVFGAEKRPSSFRPIVVTAASPPAASLTVRLPDGVQLDIRSSLAELETLVARLVGDRSEENGKEAIC